MTTDYDKFIAGKSRKPIAHGFDPVLPLNTSLFDWQKVVVTWAIKQGRCALFEDCGLGKTLQQLEWARHVQFYTGGMVLILCPLAVADQTMNEGRKFGIEALHVHDQSDCHKPGIYITNYDRLDKFTTTDFAGVVLDESSILKAFTGKTKMELVSAFEHCRFRLCCTATPSPNDITELCNHAEFLGVGKSAQILATWFINDTGDTGEWKLKGHAESDFWEFVSTWAACVFKPSDIGYSDEGYNLPPLNMVQHVVDVDTAIHADGELFRMGAMSATNIHAEMRLTCPERVAKCAGIVNESTECWTVWCNTNYESDALKAAIPDAVEVRGADSEDKKERAIAGFLDGSIRVLISKPSMFGYGLNLQHCANVAFVGLSYSFEDFYQALRRSYRFGQKRPVNCHVITAATEHAVLSTVKRKIEQHQTMQTNMRNASALLTKKDMTRMKLDITTDSTSKWTAHNGDCVRVARSMADESVDFSVFSPPFADLFTYSDDKQDMGNCKDLEEFMHHFKFLVAELLRVTTPGRLAAVHCVDLMASKWKDGEIELKNFSGEIVDAFRDAGWLYHCRVTIWKDPVIEMQRTKALGLLHKQLKKDSAMSRTGSPEYVLMFRKPGKNPKPIDHTAEEYPVELWQKDASPVWMDIDQGNVLNGKMAREDKDQKHICPLQLDVINRLLRLWSKKGDTVFSPFMGIGSEGYCAVKQGRRFIGSELKEAYWRQACKFLTRAEEESRTLFDL
jgi:DNA modification methylase